MVAAKKARPPKSKTEPKTDERPDLTLPLPIDLREAITEESRVKGDLARIVLFALAHVDMDDVVILQTRKAGLLLTNPQMLHVGAEARQALKKWAEKEGVSINAIVVSVLDHFFKHLKKSKPLREKLKLEIPARRGYLPIRISIQSPPIQSASALYVPLPLFSSKTLPNSKPPPGRKTESKRSLRPQQITTNDVKDRRKTNVHKRRLESALIVFFRTLLR